LKFDNFLNELKETIKAKSKEIDDLAIVAFPKVFEKTIKLYIKDFDEKVSPIDYNFKKINNGLETKISGEGISKLNNSEKQKLIRYIDLGTLQKEIISNIKRKNK
jgi:hypothetical protein